MSFWHNDFYYFTFQQRMHCHVHLQRRYSAAAHKCHKSVRISAAGVPRTGTRYTSIVFHAN
jgi:hypothetical protein